jgi:hypothetical protein
VDPPSETVETTGVDPPSETEGLPWRYNRNGVVDFSSKNEGLLRQQKWTHHQGLKACRDILSVYAELYQRLEVCSNNRSGPLQRQQAYKDNKSGSFTID